MALETGQGWPVHGRVSLRDAKRIKKLLAARKVSGPSSSIAQSVRDLPRRGRYESRSGRCLRPVTARATTGAAYQLPTTNRMIGPKLTLAGAPTK
jgi:hypothetical protein